MAGRRTLRLAISLAAVALNVAAAAPALADARLCRQLEAQLAATGDPDGSAALYKYEDAIARQRDELIKARRQARGQRCGFSLLGNGVRQCATLNATIEKMAINLEALQRKRGQLAGGDGEKSRARLLASLDANGCRDGALAGRPLPPPLDDEAAEPSDRLTGFGDAVPPLDEDLEVRIRRVINGGDGQQLQELGRSYRTTCVRTCDGYFFPMSYAASLADFERDQKECDARCPGTEMQVFFHEADPNRVLAPGADESATMISTVTGSRYSELPSAYLYKSMDAPRPKSCGCNPTRDFETLAGAPPAGRQTSTESGSFVTTPEPKPKAPAPTAAIAGEAKPEAVAVEPDGDRKVRVVGPRFLPDPEAAIDLRAPDQPQAR
ncbi:DUF2865 domain-containing protein [Mesorhizobium sp. AaZ16]|uniref:DUF2865 domain-containing protein n=1 Tax=Mesorhizobium sp. AaZ16 TaxID=3402289 RepID=UPI00374ECE90